MNSRPMCILGLAVVVLGTVLGAANDVSAWMPWCHPARTAVLQNDTGVPITYLVRYPVGAWSAQSLGPGQALSYSLRRFPFVEILLQTGPTAVRYSLVQDQQYFISWNLMFGRWDVFARPTFARPSHGRPRR